MSQKRLGSEGLEERLDEMLDDFNASIGFNSAIQPEEDINKYLEMSRVEMEAYDSDSCFEIAAYLIQYAVYLQRVYNRQACKYSMHNTDVQRMAGKSWANYPDVYGASEIKIAMIAEDNEAMQAAIKLRNRAQFFMKEMEKSADVLRIYARAWEEMGRSRKVSRNGY